MEEYSGYAVSILLQDRSPQSGRTQPGSNLYKSTKWTDPTKGQTYTSPQSGRTPPRVKTSPQNGRTQPGSNLYIHKVDRLQLGSRPRRGRTQQGSNLFQMNGSGERSKSHFIGLMDTTKIKNFITRLRGRRTPLVLTI